MLQLKFKKKTSLNKATIPIINIRISTFSPQRKGFNPVKQKPLCLLLKSDDPAVRWLKNNQRGHYFKVCLSACVWIYLWACRCDCADDFWLRERSGFDLNPRGLISSKLSGTLSTQTTVLKVVRAPNGTHSLSLPPTHLLSKLLRQESRSRHTMTNTSARAKFGSYQLYSTVGRYRTIFKGS